MSNPQVKFLRRTPAHYMEVQTFHGPEGIHDYHADASADLLVRYAPAISSLTMADLKAIPPADRVNVLCTCTLEKGTKQLKTRQSRVMDAGQVVSLLRKGMADAAPKPKAPQVAEVGAITPTYLRLLFKHFGLAQGVDYESFSVRSPSQAVLTYNAAQDETIDRVWRALRQGGLMWCESTEFSITITIPS